MKTTPLYIIGAVFLIAVFTSCQNTEPTARLDERAQAAADSARQRRASVIIDTIRPYIQSGDLVLRTGNDFTSESLRQMNRRNQDYSHCGIASMEAGKVYIYHALGGEFNPDQKIRRDELAYFADPAGNRGIAVYRYNFTAAEKSGLVDAARQLQRAGIMFDMQFDLASNDRMYCAEYIYKCLLISSKGKIRCSTSYLKAFEFVGVDDLFLYPGCRNVETIVYK